MKTRMISGILLVLLANMLVGAFDVAKATMSAMSISEKSPKATDPSYPYEEFIIVGDYVDSTTLKLWHYYSGLFEKTLIDTITGMGGGADLEIFDADDDGDLDFIAIIGRNTNTPEIRLYRNNDVPTHPYPTVNAPDFTPFTIWNNMLPTGNEWGSRVGISSGDFDNDGDTDFVAYSACDGRRTCIYVFINNGGLAFVQSATLVATWAYLAFGIDVGDFNEDGNLDFVMFDYPNGDDFQDDVAVYWGNGFGDFPTSTAVFRTLHAVNRVTVQDFNDDGHFDIIIGKDDDGDPGQTWFYAGNGVGGFAAPIESFDLDPQESGQSFAGCGGMGSYDVRKNGHMDVIACASGQGKVYYLEGMGTGQFLPEEQHLIDDTLTNPDIVAVPPWGMGYFIIVEGSCYGNLQDFIRYGCEEVFRILREKGFIGYNIYFMGQNEWGSFDDIDGDGFNDVDGFASSSNLQWAIETWAAARVRPTEPLFLYLFDHGDTDRFCIDSPDEVTSRDLDTWLTNLETSLPYPIPICLIYAACHSGSFIESAGGSISRNHPGTVQGKRWTGRVVVCSSRSYQPSWVWPPCGTVHWEFFSVFFWENGIRMGFSVGHSFNIAYSSMKPIFSQDPTLDDDGCGVEQPPVCSLLPWATDGLVAFKVNIGRCEWVYPWISYVVAKQYFTWPPPPTVTLWAKVENKTPLSQVRAWMKPPDWTPPSPDTVLLETGWKYFEMTDPDGDGNWAVNIPAINFTNHATGPSDFKFIIDAIEVNNRTAIPRVTGVGFTETGQPPLDTTKPIVHILRPIDGRSVGGTVKINGTASDDVCLKRVELYVDGNLAGIINLPPTSNSFFEFNFNTKAISNGGKNILVKAFDTSDHIGNQTVTAKVTNPPVGVGGIVVPVDKFGLLAPYIGLASTILVATVATAIYVKRAKRRKEMR